MHQKSASLEIIRWGYACIPGVLFSYAKELDLDMEDIGVLVTVFYAMERSKPLYQTGIKAGQVLQACPSLSKQKLSKKISRLKKLCIVDINEDKGTFPDKIIYLEPLLARLEELVLRDHAEISARDLEQQASQSNLVEEYREKIVQLELQLEEEKNRKVSELFKVSDKNYKRVADFISKKTGNLMSVKMANELHKWLNDLAFTPEFLLCMLELCFERQIYNPREISQIARDLHEYSINTVEGMGLYFTKYVDKQNNKKLHQFDPEILEFGQFTGIDMNAEARKKLYYKWHYDWGFSHAMIMKAGELMCQRTKNGGLEYIDSVLNNWLCKEIRRVEDAEKEIKDFKARSRSERSPHIKDKPRIKHENEYEIYVPPSKVNEAKSKI